MLKLERLVNEATQRLTRVEEVLQNMVQSGEATKTRVDAFERAIPERLHNTEARQANHVELMNQFSSYVNAQMDAMNQRVNMLEKTPKSPDFGTKTNTTQNFGIGTPTTPSPPNENSPLGSNAVPQNPFAGPRPTQPEPHTTSNEPNPDPWAHSRWGANQGGPRSTGGSVPFIKREWNVSEKKVSKQLVPFDGDVYHYKSWSNRVKDHCNEVNTNYIYVFDTIEAQKLPIKLQNCATVKLTNGVECDFAQIAGILWSFLRNNVNDKVHERSLELTFNQPGNGLELWRALFVENEGGAEQVQLGGMTNLHSFPQCPSAADLQHYIGQWQITRQKFGHGLPDIHLKQMFLNMLPDKVAAEIREKKELVTLQHCINHVLSDIGRFNDGRLAKVHAQRLKQNLAHGTKNPVSALIEEPSEAPKSAESELVYALSKKLDGLVAAMAQGKRPPPPKKPTGSGANSPRGGSGLPRPNPKFKGCWCCGDEGHTRQNCDIFKDLIKKNGGKVPAGYKGAYEKYMDKLKSKKIAALTHEPGDDQESDFDETEVWAMTCGECDIDAEDMFDDSAWECTCGCEVLKALSIPPPTDSTPVCTNFEALAEVDEEENDEDDMIKALQQISSNITVGPKKSQKQKKATAAPSPLTRRKIAAIAEQVKSGEISLPSLRLHNNGDYECVWALVDSGAGRPCARKNKHFVNVDATMVPSKVRLTTATGQEVKSGGVFKVECKTAEGNTIIQEFEDTDVDMPIVSVSSLSKNGSDGSQVNFRQNGGEVVDLFNGDASKFVKRRGVYFMKLFYKKSQSLPDKNKKPVFSRPGRD